jgi:N-acetylneuraminic acid mutarotase
VVFNSKLYVIGGYSSTGFKNDVWSSADGRNWIEEISAGSKFVPLYSHQAIVYNNTLYVLGGLVGFVTTDEIWSSTNGKDWTKQTAAAFGTRGGHQALLFNNKIYVIGGYDAASVVKNDVWISN